MRQRASHGASLEWGTSPTRERIAALNSVLLTAEAYGRSVGVRLNSGDQDAVVPLLPHWWQDSEVQPERVWELSSAGTAESVIGELELWVAEHAVDLIFVHAGVVAFDGQALLLPGRSFSGKTTLTAALLRAGAIYGSDEYAVLSADGLVLPYPRPLSLRGQAARTRVTASELGAATFAQALPVAAVAELRYVPDCGFDVQPMSPGTTVLRLFDNTVCAQSRPETALDALVAASADVRAVAGNRGDADTAVAPLRALMRATA